MALLCAASVRKMLVFCAATTLENWMMIRCDTCSLVVSAVDAGRADNTGGADDVQPVINSAGPRANKVVCNRANWAEIGCMVGTVYGDRCSLGADSATI